MSELDRIRKLIALSGSSNEHEARSAAFLACKLIREGDYRVVENTPEPPAWRHPFDVWAEPPPPPRERRPKPDTRPRRQVPSEVGRAKWSGRCAVCDEAIEEGSDVALPILADDAKLGVAHADCRARWSVLAEPRRSAARA